MPWVRALAEGDTRLLAGQISALCDVRLQPGARVASWPNALDHGMAPVLTLVERVQAGALLLFARGSFRCAFFDQVSSRGIWWMRRDAYQASAQVSHLCSQADGVLDAILSLGTSQGNQARSPVRVIPCWLHGRHARSLTNVLDPHLLKRSDVVGLDARRWEIELAFRALKDRRNLHHLWSAKEAVVHVQLWCCPIPGSASPMLCRERLPGTQAWRARIVSLDLLVHLTPG